MRAHIMSLDAYWCNSALEELTVSFQKLPEEPIMKCVEVPCSRLQETQPFEVLRQCSTGSLCLGADSFLELDESLYGS